MSHTKKDIVIIGAGSFGREVLWTLQDLNSYNILGFIDEYKDFHGKIIDGFPVLGDFTWFDKHPEKVNGVICVGDVKKREKIYNQIKEKNIEFPGIIHPSVIMSKSIHLSEGVIIQAGCILTVDIEIGKHTHINLDCTLGHNDRIGEFVTISPGSHINGKNNVGNKVFIGSGVVTKEGITINENSVIGAGAVVLNDVPANSLAVGIPAKIKKNYSMISN